MQVGRRLFQRKVVILMAMCAPALVKMLPFHLMPGEFWGLVAAQDYYLSYGKRQTKNRAKPTMRNKQATSDHTSILSVSRLCILEP